jgi:hypothetical protein
VTGADTVGGEHAALIERAAGLLREHYVFPHVGDEIATVLNQRLAEGGYRHGPAVELARAVTTDLQSVNGDRHLRLIHHTEAVTSAAEGAASISRLRRDLDASLGGVPRVHVLPAAPGSRPGGPVVALLELAPALYPLEWAAESITAAFGLVSRAGALVLDLRGTLGGSPDTIAFVCTYLLDERTHLNTMYEREGDRYEQYWTLPFVPGSRFGGSRPLYVLVSRRTFSGGEELTYNLQQLGRGVVVGEVTGGGAHPCRSWSLSPQLELTIPIGRAINPVSGTNWEGVGVTPDVACPAADALERAHALALARLAELEA